MSQASTSTPLVKSESIGVLYNIELENDSESGYDCVEMDEIYDDKEQSDSEVDTNVATTAESSEENHPKEPGILDSDNILEKMDSEKTDELTKILDAFSVNSDGDEDDSEDENEDHDAGAVSSAMIYSLAKSVQNIKVKDEDTLDRSFTSSKFLGKADKDTKKFAKTCTNDCSTVGNLLGISSVAIPETEPKCMKSSYPNNYEEISAQNNIDCDDSSKEDLAQSTITILSSVHGNIENFSPASNSDSVGNHFAKVSTSSIDESENRNTSPHKKIYLIFFGLFIFVIIALIEKIYRMHIAMEHLEFMHNRKLLSITKHHEMARTGFQKEIDELKMANLKCLSDENVRFNFENEKNRLLEEIKELKFAKARLLNEAKSISAEPSNGEGQPVFKSKLKDYPIFEEGDKGYEVKLRSCWGEMGFTYKTGQCTAHVKDVVSQGFSSTKDTIKRFVHGTPTTEVATVRENISTDKTLHEPPAIAFLVGNETYNFTTLMYKIATEPVKTTRDVLQNAIDIAKETFD